MATGKGDYISALFMEVSKVFDTINHGSVPAHLKTYGFSKEALN